MTALLLLRRFWPVIAALAVAGALWLWGNSRYEAGYDKAMQEATEAAAAAAKAMQDDWNAAHVSDTQRRAATADKFRPLKERAANAPVDLNCPDAATRQLLDEAIRAANNPASPAKGS